jgi:hypothetical protein
MIEFGNISGYRMDQTMHKKWLMHLQEVIFLLELVGHLEGTPGRIDRDHGALGPLRQVALASVPLTTLQLEVEFLIVDCVDYS